MLLHNRAEYVLDMTIPVREGPPLLHPPRGIPGRRRIDSGLKTLGSERTGFGKGSPLSEARGAATNCAGELSMQIFRDFIYSLSATNIVDMLIITCMIYLILATMRGSRSFQILISLLALALFYVAASRVGLVLTSVIFQYLSAVLIIVLVIVFQPEIREMLDRASPIRYLRGRRAVDTEPDLVEEVLGAVGELARQRLGALIVFQRRERLGDLVLKGKELDCVVSSEILLAIFQKTSPLHDGAVLIKGDRIRAASCILPLSTDETLSSQYGTRHRAAVGLSERSDALCLVVSEERGEVSLVDRGQIHNYSRRPDFRLALRRGLVSEQPRASEARGGLFRALISNWHMKLASLAAAMLLWFMIVGPQRSVGQFNAPIQYTNLPTGVEITGKWVDRVDVRIRGSESSLAKLNPESVRALVDLNDVLPGVNFFRISAKDLRVPPGFKVVDIEPSDLHLSIVAASSKIVKVMPMIEGILPPGSRVLVVPAQVKVRGADDELKKVESAVTDPIKIEELVSARKMEVPVSIRPEGLKIGGIDPLQVTVSLEGQ